MGIASAIMVEGIRAVVDRQLLASQWFYQLRDSICISLEGIEQEYAARHNYIASKFIATPWNRSGGGGGVMSSMRGQVFEKAGVNISTVYGEFSDEFRNKIPGTENNPSFWASGISLVIHPHSPLVPAIHFNTRFIVTEKAWFGGGADLTPNIANQEDADFFHNSLQQICDKHDPNYYSKFKLDCDKYFYLPHRKEARGIGGIFYDYLQSESGWESDFSFTKDLGQNFARIYETLVKRHMYLPWNDKQKEQQLLKRGRYVEFNLLYDRGTKFGLMTDGNTEAILMSLPPVAKWL